MAPGISLVIIGAILAFAVRTDSSVLDLQIVGLIFMLAGAAIIAHFRRERRQKQIVTRVEHSDPGTEQAETVQETVTHETVYEGDEPAPSHRPLAPPPPSPRSVQGYDTL